MRVTVILCTFNRCELLQKALESIALSAMPEGVEWEVLVVDNNSKDRTREIVREMSERFPGRFRYLFEGRPGKSYALNSGIGDSTAEVLAFTDDDVTVAPDWLCNLIAPLSGDEYAGVAGRVFPQWNADPPPWLAREGWLVAGPLVHFDLGEIGRKLAESPVGANMAFQRRVFAQYGGFRVDLGPSPKDEIRNEDSEFARRLENAKEALYYNPSAIVYHYIAPERLQQRYFLRWWFDKGRSEVREYRVSDAHRIQLMGVPLYLLRRSIKWSLKWLTTVDSRRRFECKVGVWFNVGQIVEHRLGGRSTMQSAPTAAETSL